MPLMALFTPSFVSLHIFPLPLPRLLLSRDFPGISYADFDVTVGRRIVRRGNEALIEKLEEIYQKEELPFGHMKRNLGAGQFVLRGRKGVNAELSLCRHVSI